MLEEIYQKLPAEEIDTDLYSMYVSKISLLGRSRAIRRVVKEVDK